MFRNKTRCQASLFFTFSTVNVNITIARANLDLCLFNTILWWIFITLSSHSTECFHNNRSNIRKQSKNFFVYFILFDVKIRLTDVPAWQLSMEFDLKTRGIIFTARVASHLTIKPHRFIRQLQHLTPQYNGLDN